MFSTEHLKKIAAHLSRQSTGSFLHTKRRQWVGDMNMDTYESMSINGQL